jgi:hypothetical protein
VSAASVRQAEWWWVIDTNIVIDLNGLGTAPKPAAAPTAKKEEAFSSDFDLDSDDNDGDNTDDANITLDFNAFDRR